MLHLNNRVKEKKNPKAQALLESEDSGSDKNISLTSAPASRDRKRKSSDENGDKKSPATNPTRSAKKPSRENKSSRKLADVEAAQLRAKTFFDSVTVDLSSDIDEPPVTADTASDPAGNRDEPSSIANGISEIEVLPVINKDTSRSTHTPRTPLSRPLHSNQHAATFQVRKESTSRSTSAINSPSTSSTPITKNTSLIPPENNYHIPVSPIYHLESPVTHQSNSYMDLFCEDEDSSTQNLSTLLSSAIRHSYDVESPQGAQHIEKSPKASANSCPDCALYKARNEELEARLNELEDKCQCKHFY